MMHVFILVLVLSPFPLQNVGTFQVFIWSPKTILSNTILVHKKKKKIAQVYENIYS